MVPNQLVKFVKSLKLKKYRKEAHLFVVEGYKNVLEVLNSDYKVAHLFLTERFLQEFGHLVPQNKEHIICKSVELASMGSYETNEYALAVVKVKDPVSPPSPPNLPDLMLALDDIRDPGNLGTIIRIADWYGISTIIASEETADIYNPKVLHASMGSFTRVDVHYINLAEYFQHTKAVRVYGAGLEGHNIHELDFERPAIVLIGNESHGISDQLKCFINHAVTIPRYGHAESLNAAIATAIICDNFFRG